MREPDQQHEETTGQPPSWEAFGQGEHLVPEPSFGAAALAEPMDDLLAELLAQDVDLPSDEEQPAGMLELSTVLLSGGAQKSPPAVPSEAKFQANLAPMISPELLPEPNESEPAIPAWAAGPEPRTLQAATDPPALEAPGEPAALDYAAAQPAASEAGVFQLQAEEPEAMLAPWGSPELLAESTEAETTEAEPVEAEPATLAVDAEPAPRAKALGPQPALDHVVSIIDAAYGQASAPNVRAESAPAVHHKQFSQLDDYVVFVLSGTDYALAVRDVAEIGRVPAVTRVPNLPQFIRGVTNLRGEVVPVLNLSNLLGLQDAPLSARGRVLFLRGRDRISATGLLVDEVKGIQRIQSHELEQVSGLLDDKITMVLRGVHGRGDRVLNVLDVEQLFQLQEFRQLATS